MRLILVLTFIFVAGIYAYTVAPSSIILQYNAPASENSPGVLSVDVKHITKDVNKDFIKEIDLYVNGLKMDSKLFTRQSSVDNENTTFSLKANPGDIIRIRAISSVYGTKNIWYTPVPAPEPKPSDNSNISSPFSNFPIRNQE